MSALILAIFYSMLALAVSVGSLFFIVFPVISNPSVLPVIKHLLLWPSLFLSAMIGRGVFCWVIKFLCVEDKKTQEVAK